MAGDGSRYDGNEIESLVKSDTSTKEDYRICTFWPVVVIFTLIGFTLGVAAGSCFTFHKMDDPYNQPKVTQSHYMTSRSEQPYIRVSYLGDNKFFFGFIVEESKNISKDGDHRLKLIAMRVAEIEKRTGLMAISTQAVHVESGGAQLLSGAIVDFKNPSQ